VSYLTDHVCLCEELRWRQNFGLAGRSWLTVRDSLTVAVRSMSDFKVALCEPFRLQPARAVARGG
jgi:hypothetical protein